jgi:hypothetical protein
MPRRSYSVVHRSYHRFHTIRLERNHDKNDKNRKYAGCKPRYFIYDLQDFLLDPKVFHDTIRGSYCISLGCNRIVFQILASHKPITHRSGHDTTYFLMELTVHDSYACTVCIICTRFSVIFLSIMILCMYMILC